MFYATIVWSIGYWIVYPAWPLVTSATNGMFGWHSREAVVADLDALKAQRGPMVGKLAAASLPEILADPQLLAFRPRAGPAGLRRELRALPWRRRRRRQGLSEPERRRLALGRQARRHRRDHPPRHPLRRRQGAAGAGMPAFGRDGTAEARRHRQRRRLCPLARRPAGRPEGRSRRRQEGLRRQLRDLPRRRRQGQPRRRRAEPDRRDLAVRRRQGRDRRRHLERPRRRHAGLGRAARRRRPSRRSRSTSTRSAAARSKPCARACDIAVDAERDCARRSLRFSTW